MSIKIFSKLLIYDITIMSNLNSRIRLEHLALKKGITNPHEMTTESLIELLLSDYLLYRRELNIIARNLDIKSPNKLSSNKLMSILRNHFLVKKLNDLGLNKLATRHIQINELDRKLKLNELTHDTLKKLAKLQQIKNFNTLLKQDLIYVVLRSKNPNENKYISSITNRIDTNDLDNELRAVINTIRETLNRLGNILTNQEWKEITKELYETLKKVNNTDKNTRVRKRQKERLLRKLIEQNNELVKKEQFVLNRYDDLEYQGISDTKPIYYFSIIDVYYNPELIESSFNHNYERYQINGDKNKELSLNDYLNVIKETLVNLLTTL